MKIRVSFAIALGLALGSVAFSQDPSSAPAAGQTPGMGGYGQRGGRGFGGMGMMGNGRGVAGTVTEAAPDHYTIKTFEGEIYTIHFSANTRIMKQRARMRGEGGGRGADSGEAGGGAGTGEGMGRGMGGNPPEQIKASDIKVGDAIAAMGEVDAQAKSVGAVAIVELDPQRARQMQEMAANYGKTWLMGKVTAIDGVKVTLQGVMDHAPHTFVATENTDFRERREPITLADVKVGDMVRVEGALASDGTFSASTVNLMRAPQGGPGGPGGPGGGGQDRPGGPPNP